MLQLYHSSGFQDPELAQHALVLGVKAILFGGLHIICTDLQSHKWAPMPSAICSAEFLLNNFGTFTYSEFDFAWMDKLAMHA